MNKFRVNLHSALFTGNVEAPKTNAEVLSKEELQTLKNEIKDEVSGKKQARIDERLNKEASDKETNDAIWTTNIVEGYGRLVTALRENHYFDDKDESQELPKIKKQYQEEVKSQYKKLVGKRSDKKFDNVKENLFDTDSPNSPANKIYTQLTGATTISKVDRQYTEGYDVDFLGKENMDKTNPDTFETEIDKKNRKFLSNDLPEYLWNIRKTPGVLNVMKWLPIFSVKTDRPSKVDREAISDFLKAANRLPVKNGKSPATVLMEALHDNTLNTDSTIDTYVTVLKNHGMDLDGFKKKGTNDVDYKQFRKCISEIMKVGSFYIDTQKANNNVKDQHAIYLSVLKIIETSGGADKAVDRFEEIIEKAKGDQKTEKKEGYEGGEKLTPEFKKFAEKLGITDFTNATRLSNLDPTYFTNTSVEKILANLNNDNIIDARDTMAGGLKTGSQFLNVFKQVSSEIGDKKEKDVEGKESIIKGSDQVLNNLLNRAKLDNKVLGLGLDESKFTKEEIQGGNKELILLLQNIINKPGEDLYTLLSGHEGDPFKGLDLNTEKKAAENYVAEEFKKMDQQALRGIGLQTPENIQTGLAGALFEAYKRGVGVGGQISFDQWVKGLAMNTGFQVRDDGNVVVGIGLDYKKKINLGKGWSTTPDASAGVFIPLGYGRPDVTGTVGLNDEVAKERVTTRGVQQKLGMQAGVTLLIPTATPIISAGLSWERNKAAGIEHREQELRGEMQDKMKKILKLVEQDMGDKKILNFEDTEIIKLVENKIREVAKDSGVKEKDVDTVVNATKRLLINYNGANLSDENVRDIIATKVADQYAMAWAEDRKAHITNKAYLSGANLGAFWVAGSPLVGIYAGVKFTKHDLDGYGDRYGQERAIDNSKRTEKGVRDVDSIKDLNTRLGFTEGQGLKFVEKNRGIQIPKSVLNKVKVSESMQKLLVKDEEGNVIISPWTTMGESIAAGTGTQSKELFIGEGNSNFVALDTTNNNWFATDIQAVNKAVLTKENTENFYTTDGITRGIDKLKAENPNNKVLNSFKPTEEDINDLIKKLQALQNKDKMAKVIITRQPDGTFKMEAQDGVNEGKGLEFEYKAKLEMFNSKAKNLANKVYERAAKLDNPQVLNSVKHPLKKRHQDYENFVDNLGFNGKTKNLTEAKKALEKIIDKTLNNGYPNNKLEIKAEEWPTDDPAALEQALLSINNVFARSTKVKGAGTENDEEHNQEYNKYNFTTNMGNIIQERERQIGGTLQDRIGGDANIKKSYAKLMKAMGKHRIDNQNEFKTKSARAVHLDNAVGFNLGDKYKPENPLLNPEIYEQVVNLKDLDSKIFTEEDSKRLYERAMKNFVNQPALFASIKAILGVPDNAAVSMERDNTENTFKLDIGKEKVKINADMKFGYFTQCVNHTVILENIKLEDKHGNVVEFRSGAWRDGKYVEGNKTSIVSTTTVGVEAAVTFGRGEKGNNEPENSEVNTQGGTHSTEGAGTQTQHDGVNDNEVNTNNTAGTGSTSTSHGGRPGQK